MRYTEIDNSKVIHEFTVLWHEWECDGYGWVTEDGRAWLTSHGGPPYETEATALLERMDVALCSVTSIRKGLSLMANAQGPVQAKGPKTEE